MKQRNLRLELFIKENDLNQTTFGQKIGFSRQAVSGWLSKQQNPSQEALIAIAEAFNCDPEELNETLGFNIPLPIESLPYRVKRLEERLFTHLDEAESVAGNYVLGILKNAHLTTLDVLIATPLTAKDWQLFTKTGQLSDRHRTELTHWLTSVCNVDVEIPTEAGKTTRNALQ